MTFFSQKLEHVNQYLLASGWQKGDRGWIYPENLREDINMRYGDGQFRTSVAIYIQVQFDEFRANEVM